MKRTLHALALSAFGLALPALLAPAPALAAQDGPVITLTDGVVSPRALSLPAGKPVTLTVRNTGKSAAEFESKRLRVEEIIAPGRTVKIRLRALPAGSYPFVEEFHETLDSAKGTITVN